MNAFARLDKAAFYRFIAGGSEGRYEFVRGRIVQQMTGGTREHGAVARRITRQIEDQLDLGRWWVLNERGVDTPTTVRLADVVVEPADEPRGSLATARPALIAEVLSPSTAAADLDEKTAEYMSLPSLDAYVIASQDEAAMLIYERGADGLFPAGPREAGGPGAEVFIRCRPFAVTLRLDEIYQGIV